MTGTHPTLHLYCINIECIASVSNNTMHIRIPLTAENLTTAHHCFCCNQRLVSAIDMEIEQLAAGYILN